MVGPLHPGLPAVVHPTWTDQVNTELLPADDELLEEGVKNRIAHYQTVANTLRDGLASLELTLLVPRERPSNSMTSVMLPEGVSYSGLHDPLKERGLSSTNPRASSARLPSASARWA